MHGHFRRQMIVESQTVALAIEPSPSEDPDISSHPNPIHPVNTSKPPVQLPIKNTATPADKLLVTVVDMHHDPEIITKSISRPLITSAPAAAIKSELIITNIEMEPEIIRVATEEAKTLDDASSDSESDSGSETVELKIFVVAVDIYHNPGPETPTKLAIQQQKTDPVINPTELPAVELEIIVHPEPREENRPR